MYSKIQQNPSEHKADMWVSRALAVRMETQYTSIYTPNEEEQTYISGYR